MRILQSGHYSQLKPPFGSFVNEQHPLAFFDYMIFCCLLNDNNLNRVINQARTDYNGTPSGIVLSNNSKFGTGYESDTAGSDLIDFASGGQILPTTENFTAVIGYKKTDGTNRISGAFGYNHGLAAQRLGVHLPYNDGKVYWDFGGTSEGSTRLSVSGLSFGDDIWVFTKGPRGMEIWQNGALVGSNSANPTRSAGIGSSFHLFNYGSVGSDLAICSFFYAWKLQLPAQAIKELSTFPFQIINAPNQKSIYVVSFDAPVGPGFQVDAFQNNAFQTQTVDSDEVTPSPITVTWSVVAPSLSTGGVNLTPSPVVSTWSVVAPSLSTGGVNLTPSPVVSTWSVIAPTITNGDVNLTPSPITVTWSVVAPTVEGGDRNIQPTPITVTWSVVAPTITNGGINLTPSPITVTWSVVAPTITNGGINLTPSPITVTWSVVAPSITYDTGEVTPSPVIITWSVVAPSLSTSGGNEHQLLYQTINGGILGTNNSIEADILLILKQPSTSQTSLLFTYKYGGVIAGTLSTEIHDGAVGLNVGEPIWLNFLIEANNNSNSQNTIVSKYSNEIGVENVLSEATNTLGVDSTVNQIVEISSSVIGDLSTTITREYVILKQLSP